MNFKQATDELLASVTLADLAKAMGVPLQNVRQARAAEGTAAHRPPPDGWQQAVQRLAARQASRLGRLAKRVVD